MQRVDQLELKKKKKKGKKQSKSLCKQIRNTKYFELNFCSLNWLYVWSTVQFGVCFCCAVAAGCWGWETTEVQLTVYVCLLWEMTSKQWKMCANGRWHVQMEYEYGYSKTRYKKLFTHVESQASAVSLL